MKNRFLLSVIIAVVVVITTFIVCVFRPFWRPFERRVYDLKYQLTLEEMRNSDIVIVDIDEKSLEKLGRYQNWPRAYYAKVITFLDNARVIAFDILFAEPDTLPAYTRQYYDRPSFDSLVESSIENSGNVVLVSTQGQKPVYTKRVSIGLGDLFADSDGIVRRGFNELFGEPTFAAQVATSYGITPALPSFLIFFKAEESYRRISFSDVFLRRVPKEFFNDKVVIIGGTARGLFDFHGVPYDRQFPGVVLQAILVDNFINNDKITEIPLIYIIMITIVLSCVFSYLALTKPAYVYIIICGIIYALLIIGAIFMFSLQMDIGIVRPTYALVLTLICALIYRYQFVEREKRELKHIFSRYYSRELVEQVTLKPPKLGGEKVDCTIIFADIRNFTPFAEKTSPESVGLKLNAFLDEMVKSIFEYQGRVDKFIGDCVMAVFGSPVAVRNHAVNACRAALDMVAKAEKIGFKIGIGINSGEVISGNFGSPMRMEYTVIGDAVNLASRLEGQTKVFNASIVCGADVYSRVKDQPDLGMVFEELGKVKVKGKEEEVTVYSVKRA